MRILIAEDEMEMAKVIREILKIENLESDIAGDGIEAEELLKKNIYDCIVLDIMMPRKDGLAVLKDLRDRNDTTPVLMLTAKSTVDDKCQGLYSGANDYLGKPFAMKELVARIKNLLPKNKTNILTYSSLTLDIQNQSLEGLNTIQLSGTETKVMEFFIKNQGKSVSASLLKERFWEDQEEGIVSIYISFLRSKLESIRTDVKIIGNEREGYRLEKQVI